MSNGDRLVGFTLIGIDRWSGRLSAYDASTATVPSLANRGSAVDAIPESVELTGAFIDDAIVGLAARLNVLNVDEPRIQAFSESLGFDPLINQLEMARSLWLSRGR